MSKNADKPTNHAKMQWSSMRSKQGEYILRYIRLWGNSKPKCQMKVLSLGGTSDSSKNAEITCLDPSFDEIMPSVTLTDEKEFYWTMGGVVNSEAMALFCGGKRALNIVGDPEFSSCYR